MVEIVEVRKGATLMGAKRVPKEILILTQTSIVPYMKSKCMMQRTVARLLVKKRREKESGSNGLRQSNRPYQPSFEHCQMPTQVTYFLANSTQIESAHDPQKWIGNSK